MVHGHPAVPHGQGQRRQAVPVRRLQQPCPALLHQPVHRRRAPVQRRHVQRRVARRVRRAQEVPQAPHVPLPGEGRPRAGRAGRGRGGAGGEAAPHLVAEGLAEVGAAEARAEGERVLPVDAPRLVVLARAAGAEPAPAPLRRRVARGRAEGNGLGLEEGAGGAGCEADAAGEEEADEGGVLLHDGEVEQRLARVEPVLVIRALKG